MTKLTTAPLAALLDRLFQEAEAASPAANPAVAELSAEERERLMQSKTEYLDFYGRLKDVPLAVSRDGRLLYMLARNHLTGTNRDTASARLLVRLLFGHTPDRAGGLPVAIGSLAIEAHREAASR